MSIASNEWLDRPPRGLDVSCTDRTGHASHRFFGSQAKQPSFRNQVQPGAVKTVTSSRLDTGDSLRPLVIQRQQSLVQRVANASHVLGKVRVGVKQLLPLLWSEHNLFVVVINFCVAGNSPNMTVQKF